MRNIKLLFSIVLLISFSSCFNDLDTIPLDPSITSADIVYDSPEAYYKGLAKLYAGFATTGQEGPAGKPDISGIDEGFSHYIRGYWYHQELTTDEAVIAWNDQTIADFHGQSWTPADGFVYSFFSRIFYQVAVANEYLRQTSDDKLEERGVSAELRAKIKTYRAEARFIRALSYWHGLDLFRNVPFGTEADPVGTYIARQTNANELFGFIESELLAIESDLLDPKAFDEGKSTYGRANKAAVWTLLSKLYLNSEVYIGVNNYQKSLTYSEKVINSNSYSLEPNYANLFLADNHNSNEIIFPVNFDGIQTKTFGGMTFIIRAGIGGNIDPVKSGVASGWGGTRVTPEFVSKFPADLTGEIVNFNQGANLSKIYVASTSNSFNGSDASNILTSRPGQNGIFEGYKYFNANDEFVLFRFPSSGKFGDNGADGTLESNGANIKVSTQGLYFIKANLVNNTYVLEKRDWSIVGSAVPGGVAPLVWDTDLKMLRIKSELNIGSFVFRANGDDMLTLGDPQLDGILNDGAGAINIVKSGGHDLIVDLARPDYTYQLKSTGFDRRGIFHTSGQTLEINSIPDFTNGYAVLKFKNITSSGSRGSDTEFPDTDFPMFRLADVYLMAAEAILRGADGGNKVKATEYFNKVRERAYNGTTGNFDQSDLTLPAILDERARELYWECHRRTDLVRFGQFSDGDYLWEWKGVDLKMVGAVKDKLKVPSYRNVFPIPVQEINVNPNLQQNPGYN